MQDQLRTIAALMLLASSASASGAQASGARVAPARAEAGSIRGEWRFVRATVAPWVKDTRVANPNSKHWIGRTIRFDANRVVGPGALGCAHATYTPSSFDADALFQGNLPAPAKASAEALGLVKMPVPGTSLDCDSGLFEYHRADATTALVALDNVIWTLDRSPGAFAPDTAPAGVVQRLLEQHFSTSMGFDASTVRGKTPWLSDALRARIARYLAKPSSPNETPSIDGDPFTDSQEYPSRFWVGAGNVKGDSAAVIVRFSDGYRVRPVRYVLARQRGAWRVDDLRYENADTFSKWLR